jgi:hypothetical protein
VSARVETRTEALHYIIPRSEGKYVVEEGENEHALWESQKIILIEDQNGSPVSGFWNHPARHELQWRFFKR